MKLIGPNAAEGARVAHAHVRIGLAEVGLAVQRRGRVPVVDLPVQAALVQPVDLGGILQHFFREGIADPRASHGGDPHHTAAPARPGLTATLSPGQRRDAAGDSAVHARQLRGVVHVALRLHALLRVADALVVGARRRAGVARASVRVATKRVDVTAGVVVDRRRAALDVGHVVEADPAGTTGLPERTRVDRRGPQRKPEPAPAVEPREAARLAPLPAGVGVLCGCARIDSSPVVVGRDLPRDVELPLEIDQRVVGHAAARIHEIPGVRWSRLGPGDRRRRRVVDVLGFAGGADQLREQLVLLPRAERRCRILARRKVDDRVAGHVQALAHGDQRHPSRRVLAAHDDGSRREHQHDGAAVLAVVPVQGHAARPLGRIAGVALDLDVPVLVEVHRSVGRRRIGEQREALGDVHGLVGEDADHARGAAIRVGAGADSFAHRQPIDQRVARVHHGAFHVGIERVEADEPIIPGQRESRTLLEVKRCRLVREVGVASGGHQKQAEYRENDTECVRACVRACVRTSCHPSNPPAATARAESHIDYVLSRTKCEQVAFSCAGMRRCVMPRAGPHPAVTVTSPRSHAMKISYIRLELSW